MLSKVLNILDLVKAEETIKNYFLFKRIKVEIKINGWVVDSFYKDKKINIPNRISLAYDTQYAHFVAFNSALSKIEEKYFCSITLNVEGNKTLIVICDKKTKAILFQKVATDKYDAVFSAFIFSCSKELKS